MSSVEIELVGYIAKDPEVKYTAQEAKKVLEFSVPHENRKGETEWYNCAVWNDKRVDSLGWMKKGMGVFVRGELNITAKDGKIYRNVNVDKLHVIISGKQQDEKIPF